MFKVYFPFQSLLSYLLFNPVKSSLNPTFQVHLGDTPHNLTESDFEHLARRSDSFSGSDVSVCVSKLASQTMSRRKRRVKFVGERHLGKIQLTLLIVLCCFYRTNSKKLLGNFKKNIFLNCSKSDSPFVKQYDFFAIVGR